MEPPYEPSGHKHPVFDRGQVPRAFDASPLAGRAALLALQDASGRTGNRETTLLLQRLRLSVLRDIRLRVQRFAPALDQMVSDHASALRVQEGHVRLPSTTHGRNELQNGV